jgi:hypothetical protein
MISAKGKGFPSGFPHTAKVSTKCEGRIKMFGNMQDFKTV